jgi:hypothetical protein
MHPSKYAREHLSMPFAVGVFSHSRNRCHRSLATSNVPFFALNPVFVLRVGSSGLSDSERAAPSKSVARNVICLRTRSPVPGRMKVPFFSLYVKLISMDFEGLGGIMHTPRFPNRLNLLLDGEAGPSDVVLISLTLSCCILVGMKK